MSDFNINVKGILETLDFILENNASAVRFGEGEMDLITGKSIPFQFYDDKLANQLRHVVTQKSSSKCVICVSDIFTGLERFNDYATNFYIHHLQRYKNEYQTLCTASWYGTAFISRPYIDLKDKSHSAEYFSKIKQLWQDRDVLIVEGKLSRSGVGNDLFANAKSIERIICPSRNAYSKINEIKQAVITHATRKQSNGAQDLLVLIMLGPTAKPLAYELSEKYQCVDIGHIDTEYEWFKMGATHKVQLANKHTAEFNNERHEQQITLDDAPEYESQIVAKIE